MAYTPYYAPYSRPMGYYNPSIPQDMSNMQTNQQMPMPQQMQQIPIQSNPALMQMPTQQTNDVMLWVLNENEASSFPVAPNNSVVLWDKNNKTFYIKTANAQGIPSMQIYDFTERTETHENAPKTHKCTCGDKFVTKEEFDALKGKFYDLQARYDAITIEEKEKPVEKTKTTSKKTNESEE